jgi:hypothetical protein
MEFEKRVPNVDGSENHASYVKVCASMVGYPLADNAPNALVKNFEFEY